MSGGDEAVRAAQAQPFIALGTAVVRGYAMGRAFRWRGWPSLEVLLGERTPVILVAEYLEEAMLKRVPHERLLGIVCEHGSVIDPLYGLLCEYSRRPAVIGAPGVAAATVSGDLVLLDAGDGNVVVRPDAELARPFARMKGTRPERKPEGFDALLERLCDPIQKLWLRFGRPLPYDLPESRAIYAIAWRLAAGGMPRPADDVVIRRAIERAAERPEELDGGSGS